MTARISPVQPCRGLCERVAIQLSAAIPPVFSSRVSHAVPFPLLRAHLTENNISDDGIRTITPLSTHSHRHSKSASVMQETGRGKTSAPYGQACSHCVKAKSRCMLRADNVCERLVRLMKEPAVELRITTFIARGSTRAVPCGSQQGTFRAFEILIRD
jgi:hypothetical protein